MRTGFRTGFLDRRANSSRATQVFLCMESRGGGQPVETGPGKLVAPGQSPV
jgi:hypothetical protein